MLICLYWFVVGLMFLLVFLTSILKLTNYSMSKFKKVGVFLLGLSNLSKGLIGMCYLMKMK